MKTFETISAIALISIGLITIVVFIYSKYKYKKNLKELYALKQRNEKLSMFRIYVLTMFGREAYMSLPCYDYMLHDDKELTFENYVNVDEFINLN